MEGKSIYTDTKVIWRMVLMRNTESKPKKIIEISLSIGYAIIQKVGD